MLGEMSPERFQECAVALAWIGERKRLLRALLVEKHSYADVAAEEGRTTISLRKVVQRAREEIFEHQAKAAEALPEEERFPDPVTAVQHAAALWFAMDYRASFADCLMAVLLVNGYYHPNLGRTLSPEELRERTLELIVYKYTRDMQYALGVAPPP